MSKRNKINLIFLFSLILIKFNSVAQEYIGSNGYAKLTLLKNKKFIFQYWDCGADSGIYTLNKDTLKLYSINSPVEIKKINQFKDGELHFNFLSAIKIFRSNCLTKEIENIIVDTIKREVLINNIYFQKGDLIEFIFFGGTRKINWDDETIKSCYFELDERYGKRVYFNGYPLLINGKFILPFSENLNTEFNKINAFQFLPMMQSTKSYKLHMSGFGVVH